MREHNNFKYTCLLGGGAIRGAAHVGVLKALNSLGIEITTLAGSSVGSLIAALYSVGYNPDELAEIFLSVNFELFRDISFGFSNKFALSKGEVFLDWIKDLIERKFYGDKYIKGVSKPVLFKDLDKNLVIITTNMNNFSCREFSNFNTPEFEVAMAVRISCCMPGLMKALTFEDNMLVDGDLMKGKPMWLLSENLKNSSNRILEVRLEGSFSGSDANPVEYVSGMYSCITSTETDFIKSLYGKHDKYDYVTINTGNALFVDFNYPSEKRQIIIDEGYKQTISYFKNDLLAKKIKIVDFYSEILDYLRQIQGFMLIRRFVAAKNTLAELFICITKYKDIIDTVLFDALYMFQKLLFANVRSGLLGHSSCTNKETISTSLNSLINDLTTRIRELDKYISKFSV